MSCGISRKKGVCMLWQTVLFLLTVAGVVFCVVFNLSVQVRGHRVALYWVCALAGAVAALMQGFVPGETLRQAFLTNTAVNPLKILVLFFSMTAISVFLDEAGFYRFLASCVVEKAGTSQKRLFFILFGLVSVLTVFTSNDIIILTFTPFILYFAKNSGINPIPYIFGEFVAANTWSMCFVFGNPTNIYLSTAFDIDFMAYAHVMVPVTLMSGLCSLAVLFLVFHRSLSQPLRSSHQQLPSWNKPLSAVGLAALGTCVVCMAAASALGVEMWGVSLLFALLDLAFIAAYLTATHQGLSMIRETAGKLPWALIPFLLSMFVLILSLNQAGITQSLADHLPDTPLAYGLASFLASNLLNNIPMSVLFTSMLSSAHAGMTSVFAVILGSNLGALLTPVGALAGMMWLSILKEHSVKFSFLTFVKYGELIALPSVCAGLGCLLLI